MAAGEIHVGDTGTVFRVTIYDQDNVVRDISTYTTKQLIFRKPDGTILTKTADFYTDGTDGIIQWTTTSASDLDLDGTWKLQAKVASGSNSHKSDIVDFKVWPNLS